MSIMEIIKRLWGKIVFKFFFIFIKSVIYELIFASYITRNYSKKYFGQPSPAHESKLPI